MGAAADWRCERRIRGDCRMSTLAENVARLSATISAAYEVIGEKGGTLPEAKTASNLSAAIDSIQGGAASKYGVAFSDLLGDVDANGAYVVPAATDDIHISFDGVKSLPANALLDKFYMNLAVKSVDFPDLTALGRWSLYQTFMQCTNLSSVTFPRLSATTGGMLMP